MNTIYKISICFFLWASETLAQSPVPTATGRVIDASFGYSYLSLTSSPSTRFSLNGVNGSVTIHTSSRLGLKADLGYARVTNAFGGGFDSSVLSYLGGPVLYTTRQHHLTTYVQGLVGGARVSGPVGSINAVIGRGWANEVSWAFGGGAEYWVSDLTAFRVGADYLHTAFFNSSVTVRGQSNFRVTVSVVYLLGRRLGRRR